MSQSWDKLNKSKFSGDFGVDVKLLCVEPNILNKHPSNNDKPNSCLKNGEIKGYAVHHNHITGRVKYSNEIKKYSIVAIGENSDDNYCSIKITGKTLKEAEEISNALSSTVEIPQPTPPQIYHRILKSNSKTRGKLYQLQGNAYNCVREKNCNYHDILAEY